jgi:hypothetical protein
MSTSFLRIANGEFECVPDSEEPNLHESLPVDSDVAGEVEKLLRLARELQYDLAGSTCADVVTGTGVDTNSRSLAYGGLQSILVKLPASLCVEIIGSQPKAAGDVLDLLQEVSTSKSDARKSGVLTAMLSVQWLDWAPANHPDRRRALYLLVRLSIRSKQLPQLLYVADVHLIGDRDPWRSGRYFTTR